MLNIKIMILSITGVMVFFLILYLIFARGKSQGRRIAFTIPAVICFVAWVCMLVISLVIVNRGKVVETQPTETRLLVKAEEIQYDDGVFVLNHDGGVKAFPESITKVYADPKKPEIKYVNVTIRNIQVTEGVKIFGVWFITPNIGEVTSSVIFD